jgi:hypothetical protein
MQNFTIPDIKWALKKKFGFNKFTIHRYSGKVDTHYVWILEIYDYTKIDILIKVQGKTKKDLMEKVRKLLCT